MDQEILQSIIALWEEVKNIKSKLYELENREPVKVRVERPTEKALENWRTQSLLADQEMREYGSGEQPPTTENPMKDNHLDVEYFVQQLSKIWEEIGRLGSMVYTIQQTQPSSPLDQPTMEIFHVEQVSKCAHKWFNGARLENPFLFAGAMPSHLEVCLNQCGAFKYGDKILVQVVNQHS